MIFRKLPQFAFFAAAFAGGLANVHGQTNAVISPVGNGINFGLGANVSQGAFNPANNSDTITISKTGLMTDSDDTLGSGGSGIQGFLDSSAADGTTRYVFDFTNFTLPSSDIINITGGSGSDAITILSKGSLDVEGTINDSGSTPATGSSSNQGAVGGAGGGAGGSGGTSSGTAGSAGAGTGGGKGGAATATLEGGGGGGFGGAGGNSGQSGNIALGGAAYDTATPPLLNSLQGGSGGGGGGPNGTKNGGGGGGGGALELGATGTLTLGAASTINANGGEGFSEGTSGSSGGGGSGGGILIYAVNVTVASGAVLNASGNVGGSSSGTTTFYNGGGGGGGGDIGIYYYFQTTGSGLTEDVAGGAGGTAHTSAKDGVAGAIGIFVAPTYEPLLAIPEASSYATCLGGAVLLTAVVRRRKKPGTCQASLQV
jgi:hypothetical protein